MRTDFGLVSLCDGATTVDLRLLGPDGGELCGVAVDLPPVAARTLTEVLHTVGVNEV